MKFKQNGFIYKKIEKKDFPENWPFINDDAIIACKDNHFCIVNLGGTFFALNGAAAKAYKLKTPHEGKRAEIGKSVEPFIKLAKELR